MHFSTCNEIKNPTYPHLGSRSGSLYLPRFEINNITVSEKSFWLDKKLPLISKCCSCDTLDLIPNSDSKSNPAALGKQIWQKALFLM